MTLDPALPLIPVDNVVHVRARVGPAEVRCQACGLAMLPMYEKATGDVGLAQWACLCCWRGVTVTWSEEE